MHAEIGGNGWARLAGSETCQHCGPVNFYLVSGLRRNGQCPAQCLYSCCTLPWRRGDNGLGCLLYAM